MNHVSAGRLNSKNSEGVFTPSGIRNFRHSSENFFT